MYLDKRSWLGVEETERTHGESHNVTHVVEAPMPSIGGGKLFTRSDVQYKIAEGSLETVQGMRLELYRAA